MIYLDSCLVIYLVENHPVYGPKVASAMAAHPTEEFAVSPLVLLECLVGPLKTDNTELVDLYKKAYTQFRSLTITERVFEEAAYLCAEHGLRTPDALHLACANLGECTQLWTNDARFNAATPWTQKSGIVTEITLRINF